MTLERPEASGKLSRYPGPDSGKGLWKHRLSYLHRFDAEAAAFAITAQGRIREFFPAPEVSQDSLNPHCPASLPEGIPEGFLQLLHSWVCDLVWVRYSGRPAPEQHGEGEELEVGVILLSGHHTQASAS